MQPWQYFFLQKTKQSEAVQANLSREIKIKPNQQGMAAGFAPWAKGDT
ncbi:MAG: hypothetical protein DSM107014_07040 [Gomphosphaeria aponina SAG 52.96 = DSM 107014]|uniref:Uncharacterized protein n=1 Tax=Gomphosphaeria aponina SAG 52.96 = DSM 107014 TaxID=1521640 RepID=A0A941JPI8_9CHRO|nr:hypothetical protein [Gomphosphaeria aponina SAG 52.96 = DSM 107014]